MSTRDVSQATPSLFDTPPLSAGSDLLEVTESGATSAERANERLARDFVRWCFSVGETFRNSPDVTNLRFWIQKTGVKTKEMEETEILAAARPMFFKRIEQLTRKAEAPSN